MRKGFTLLELIVVIIIIGILGTLGFTQYTRVIEKGRTAEAKSALGSLRTQQIAYFQEKGVYASITAATDELGSGLPGVAPACTNVSYYFGYGCSSGTGTCSAVRCTGGGKPPQAGGSYTINLDILGVWSGTAGYY